jgi:hypothetical protein
MIVQVPTLYSGGLSSNSLLTRDGGQRRIDGKLVLDYRPFNGAVSLGQGTTKAVENFYKSLGLKPEYETVGTVEEDGALRGTPITRPTAAFQKQIDELGNRYSIARVSGGGNKRQFVFVDNATGKVMYADKEFKRDSPWKAPLEGLAFVGGAALGASALGGTLGTTGAGGAASSASGAGGLATSGTLPVATTTSMSSLPTIGSTAGLGTAGAAGGATNAALIESAVGTAGYGASSASAGANAGGGWLSSIGNRLASGWNALTPAQQLQLGGQLGSAVLGGLGASSSGGGSGAGRATGAANALGDIAGRQLTLADQLSNERAGRQLGYDARFSQILDEILASQRTSNDRSNQLRREYETTYLPAQRRMAETAANYDTAGRRAAAGAEAVAGVDAQLARQREALVRDLGRSGVSLDSGRSLTLDAAQRFVGARAGAAADRAARQGIEDRGIALTRDVAQMGNQTAGLSGNFMQTGLSAGGQAAGTLGQQQNVYNQTLQPVRATLGDAAGTYGQVGNLQLGLSADRRAQDRQDAEGYAGLGNIIGTLGGLWLGGKP